MMSGAIFSLLRGDRGAGPQGGGGMESSDFSFLFKITNTCCKPDIVLIISNDVNIFSSIFNADHAFLS